MADIILNNNYFDVPAGEGTPIQATCPIHGSFTAWIPFDLKGHKGYLKSNVVPCPQCKSPSLLSEGLFDFTEEVVKDLYGVQLSRQVKRRFAREVKSARTKEQAIFKAAQIHPALSESVKKATTRPDWKNNLMIVAAIVTILSGLPKAIDTADKAAAWVVEQLKVENYRQEYPQEPSEKNEKQDSSTDGDTLNERDADQRDRWNDVTET